MKASFRYAAILLLPLALRGQVASYTVISNFPSTSSGPVSLIRGSDGNFYGTGDGGDGSVFKVTPAGTVTTLYTFCASGGTCPNGLESPGVIQGSNGNLYGAAAGGSIDDAGTLFEVSLQGSFTRLATFCPSINEICNGGHPLATLLQGTDGNFYGTTEFGGLYAPPTGSNTAGTVFAVTPQGTLTTLYSFCAQTNCTDGLFPFSAVVQGADGNFYGTTAFGGAYGGGNASTGGTVFKLTPQGSLTTLYSFCAQSTCPDGYAPEGALVIGTDGNFYGTTAAGGLFAGGTVFKMTPQGVLTTLYNFCSKTNCPDGSYPTYALVQGTDGNFYGSTQNGGSMGTNGLINNGTIFRITPAGVLTTLHSFCAQSGCTDGILPSGPLVSSSGGTFYGAANLGGVSGNGVLFSITPCPTGPESCSAITVTSNANPSTYGVPVTFTATVMPVSGSGIPTGTVEFTDGETTLGTVNLAGGVAEFTISTLTAGEHSIAVVYSGDATFNPANGTLAPAQMVNQVATTTGVTTSPNPSAYYQSVALVAQVLPVQGTGTVTGTVVFKDGQKNIGTATLSGGFAALTPAPPLAVGSHSITASYGGDPNCLSSLSSAASQVVGQAATTLMLSSSVNPSLVSQQVTFTGLVTPQYGGAPSETITFYQNGAEVGSPVSVAGDVARVTATFNTPGAYSMSASYSGDSNFLASSAAPLSQQVNLIPTTTTLKASPSPSYVGQAVTLTATIRANLGAVPNGEVVKFYNAAVLLGNGMTSSGTATLATSSLAVGANEITAAYGGDATFVPSTSTAFKQTVEKWPTTSVVASSLNPSMYGESLTLSAKVTSGGPTPTGTMVFKNAGTAIGTSSLVAGSATFVTTKLPVGTDAITGLYEGDANSQGSTSVALSQVVAKATTTTALSSSKNPSTAGQSVTFTAHVTSLYATPTGTVVFTMGSATLGTVTLSNGTANFATTTLPVGSDEITATYGGSVDFVGSSASLTQKVNQTE